MNIQQAFDTALAGILSQGRSGQLEDGLRCQYRAPNGCKCNVGWLIPDESYSVEFEIASLDDVREVVPALRELPSEFLYDLQTAHDKASTIELPLGALAPQTDMKVFLSTYIEQMRGVARIWDLELKMPEGAAS